MNRVRNNRRTSQRADGPTLSLIATAATARSARHRTNAQTYELQLSFGELALIYKSLQAVKTLGALPPQDELLNDTLQLVDQALNAGV